MSAIKPWHCKWSAFRGYDPGPAIKFPALTVLIGRNNVGKTSAYAPLLLLKQTLDARNPETALLFRGGLIDFGGYKDVVTDHDDSKNITLTLDFGANDRWGHLLSRGSHEQRVPQVLNVSFSYDVEHQAKLIKSTVSDAGNRKIVERKLNEQKGTYKVSSPLLPTTSEVGRPIREVSELRKNLEQEQPTNFLFEGVGGMFLPPSWREDAERWEKARSWYQAGSQLYEVYYALNAQVTSALNGISYLGPLRSTPKRSYPLAPEPPIDVGRDGEFTAESLWRARESDVLEQTNYWLANLGYGELHFEEFGDYFKVLVRKLDSDISINLADCGAGLSQLLPLVVQGCLMREGSTLIAQQPEIHLNPAQQDIFTDFLIELCGRGQRVIIETHSEHVLARLRRRIAEGESIESGEVALYFSDSVNGRSTIEEIEIGEWGQINPESWPRGFFGEQLENSLKMALAQAKRKSETQQ